MNVLSIYYCTALTLNLLTTTIVTPPSNASKWQMGFNSTFKGLMQGELLRNGLVLCKRSDLSGVSSGLFIWNLVSITNFLTTDD